MNEHKSTQPCGCDEGASHVCEWHRILSMVESPDFEIAGSFNVTPLLKDKITDALIEKRKEEVTVEVNGSPYVLIEADKRYTSDKGYTQELTGPTNPKQPLGNKPGSDHMVEAHDIVNGDRMAAYGSPRPAYDGMAKVWSGLLDHKLKEPLTAEDVVILLTGMKLIREARKHKRDNLVDIHGYTLVLAHVQADGQ